MIPMNEYPHIAGLKVSAYTVPTDEPESDGTLEWTSTTLILVELDAGGATGVGYTYADASTASFIDRVLRPVVMGHIAFDIQRLSQAMTVAIRNEGNRGMACMAMSAVDNALWDLKARLLDLPLCRLIGMVREKAEVYGSGGFTSYSDDRLAGQLSCWVEKGCRSVKMKIGRDDDRDIERMKIARAAIGEDTRLFVDANGAYTVRHALSLAPTFTDFGVAWLEEPVSSDDLPGMKFVREKGPAEIMIAAGEYGYTPEYFLHMLQSEAIDVLQADATRCGGITGLLRAGHLCEAFHHPFSFHCAPALHLHAAVCIPAFTIGEYFHDHARIEKMLFDGVSGLVDGYLNPDLSRPGLGLEFKHPDAVRYRVI